VFHWIIYISNAAETTSSLKYKTYRVTALFESLDRGSRRKQAVLNKVKVLLSPEHQICLSELFRKIGSNEEHQSLDLDKLPVQKLVQSRFSAIYSSANSLLTHYKGHLKNSGG
jgi:hypothetical protein